MADRQAQVIVYAAGSTSSVDLTLTVSDLQAFPTAGSPQAFPLEGRTESRPWAVDVVDVGSTFSVNLSDSTGRMDILNRVAVFQVQDDGGGYNTKHTGRIADVFLNPDVGSYRVFLDDERMLERRQTIFTTSTTMQVYPPGLTERWLGFSTADAALAHVSSIISPMTLLGLSHNLEEGGRRAVQTPIADIPQSIVDAMLEDIVDNPVTDPDSTTGNFTDLRLNWNSADYEIKSFASNTADNKTFSPTFVEGLVGQDVLGLWVASTDFGAVETELTGVTLHMGSTHVTSLGLPLHIFSSSGDGQTGIHPFKLLRRIYNGDYGGQSVRISSSAFDDLENEYGHLPPQFFRITAPQNMAEWVEEHIYKPYGAIPFIDANGRIAPRSILPPSTSVVDSTGLFEFTGANMTQHPTWEHNRQSMVNVVRGESLRWKQPAVGFRPRTADGGDGLESAPLPITLEHDNVTNAGKFEQVISLAGLPRQQHSLQARPLEYLEFYSQEIFDRFGDGPIVGTIHGMSTADGLLPGDFAKVTLASYPNPESTSGRGTARLVQIMERVDEPGGLPFNYLDLGPDANALTAPAYTIARSTIAPKHACGVTITSLPTTDAEWQLRYALTATSESVPSSDSDEWKLGRFGGSQTSTGTVTLSPLPAGKLLWVETRGISRNRIRSPWSTALSTTMEALETSTFVGQVGENPSYLVPDWTVGTTEYAIEMYVDRSTSASFDSSNYRVTIPAGLAPVGASSGHGLVFENLTTATNSTDNKGLFGIRHVDSFGGVGAIESTVFTLSTSGSVGTLPDMRGINIRFGASIQ